MTRYQTLCAAFDALGFHHEWNGFNIWVSAPRECVELLDWGCRWAAKKSKWYVRCEEE